MNKCSAGTAILLAGACALALSNIFAIMVWHVPIPYSDEWEEFPRLIALHDAGYPLAGMANFLWEQHNEHRIVIPKIIYFMDMGWFDYKGYFPLVCIFVFQAMMAGMLVWLTFENGKSASKMWFFAPLTVIAAFNLVQFENFVSTFQTSFIGCFAFAVAAITLYAKYVEKEWMAYYLGAGVFATLSSLCLASGLFVWLVLALIGYLLHAKRYRQSGIFMGIFIAILATYLYDYKTPEGHASPIESLTQHTLLVLDFFVVWLGNIAGSVSSARFLGGIGLLTFIGITIHLARDKSRRTHIELYSLLGICLFVLMCGLVTSLGRVNFGSGQAMASRYATPVLIFWIGMLGGLLQLAARINRPAIQRVVVAIVPVALVVLLMQQQRGENALIGFQNRQIQAYVGVVTGAINEAPNLLLSVYPVPSSITSKLELLRLHHLSSFSASEGGQYEMNATINSSGDAHRQFCKGHIDAVSPTGRNVYQVTGWAWDGDSSDYPEWVYLARNGKIIGLGKPGIQRPDVPGHMRIFSKNRIGWQAVVRSVEKIEPTNVEAYISNKNGESCRL